MSEHPFDCPVCLQRYWGDDSSIYDDRYDDSVCYNCADETICEYWLEEQKKAPLG